MKNQNPKLLLRRDMLKMFASAGIAPSFAASLGALSTSSAHAAGDYKALVCIFLLGGNDGFNMVVPTSDAEYEQYKLARQTLAIPKSDLLAIGPSNVDNVDYGLHPSMSEIKSLFEAQKVAIVSNLGPLVRPTTATQYANGSVPLPPRLFSHNSMQNFWHSMQAYTSMDTGWAGRLADAQPNVNPGANLPMNTTLSGINLMQEGRSGTAYSTTSDGALRFSGFDNTVRESSMNYIFNTGHGHILQRQFGKAMSRSVLLSEALETALKTTSTPTTPFADDPLSADLKAVAHIIAANQKLKMTRQIFFVGLGGWDTHHDQLPKHADLLKKVSGAMGAFQTELERIDLGKQVTTFTASDFGRTLTSNGDGSDHGWSSHHLVMGGDVVGKKFYGDMPSLIIDGPDDVGRGRIVPTTSVDQYCATLAKWYGAPTSAFGQLFPNLSNFTQSDLEFMT